MIKRIYPLLLLFICSIPLAAQTGAIKGVVKDATSKETIIGANVLIEGTSQGAATDFDGGFEIRQIQPGNYNLIISFISYKTIRLEGLEVAEGKVTTVDLNLEEDARNSA
ncbi:TonB-dependent receptor [Lunatimonas lonarensis]|uniref:TonB-dependent receptor n=1 Tax=Lunatimonas lonarensis TaxID=1232681 RepID=R7ZYD5_9BACT|nr:carboxypeptidase-like regulatory domain-containing protein [Lunatimonas lonarensis]EON79102.1 TonB-dependent receptor [Lunatimonas lonarensis]